MSTDIKIKKGLNIKLKGVANQEISTANRSKTFAIDPSNFHGTLPKLSVKEGDKVNVGDTVYYAKNNEKIKFAKFITLGVCALQFVLTFYVYFAYDGKSSLGVDSLSLAFIEKVSWLSFSLGKYGIFDAEYFLGLDGLNILMVILMLFVLLTNPVRVQIHVRVL